jgi:hypothetical protein
METFNALTIFAVNLLSVSFYQKLGFKKVASGVPLC